MKNVFNYWDRLKKDLSGKYIMLFLDYDGTLTPIVNKPEKANIPGEAKKLLEVLSQEPNCKVTVISGRALEDLKNKVGIKNIIYSGNHGLEIEGPQIKFQPALPLRYREALQHIKSELEHRLASVKGVFVEDKGFSLSLHFRRAPEKQIPFIKASFHEAVTLYLIGNKVKVRPGKKVFEVRLPVEWDKGKIVLWLLARQEVVSIDRPIAPVYIGDDVTDEDAFMVLRNRGLTIFVGKKKSSCAKYYLKDTKEVRKFLRRILDMQRDREK